VHVNKNVGILTERRRAILKIVVQEYVQTARPVSSATIEAKHGLGVSSATVRNELALLEEMGYLAQPHVSGGRVPTDRGYRYYVEDLMDEPAVPADEQRTIAHQFHQIQLDLTEWLRLSAAVLAQSAHAASLVTAPKLAESHFKHLELISLQDSLALLVLVLQGGLVQQQMVMLEQPLTQDELSHLAARANRLLDGQTAAQIDLIATARQLGVERDVLEAVARLMRLHDQQDHTIIHYDGLANILGQPEFSEQRPGGRGQRRQQVADSMLHMLDLLQQGLLFRRLLPQVAEGSGVQVFIGGEGEYDDLRQYSVIVSRYGVAGGGSGMLGVLGPTRMHYGRAVAVVRFMTELLTELAGELNG
jgi:heat-inducible transcriptional repressor